MKQQRLELSWTQGKLAEKLGTTVMNVSRWERGIISPGLHFQQKLCDLFQLSPQALGLQSSDDSSIGVEAIGVEACIPKIVDPALPLTLKNTPDGIGRHVLLDQLIQQIQSGCTSIALTGLPGVGKTTLAVMLASHPTIQKCFSDGILWVGLGRHPQILTLLSRWGTLLEIVPMEMSGLKTIDAWIDTLRDRIGSRRMLLIIDDVWETVDTLPFYLNGHHCVHILTTRFPTIAHTFAYNHVYNVPEFNRDDSLVLLQQFIPDVCEAFPDEVNKIIHQVGGLPLALTLIGRHLLVHTYTGQRRRAYQHLLQLIEHVDERLSIQYPSPWEHVSFGFSHSLQVSIAMSYDTLSSQAQSALRTLAIFPPKPQSFSEEAALSICQIETAMLDELVDSGLLTYAVSDRYQLHPTISDTLRRLPLNPNIGRSFQHYFYLYLQRYRYELEKIEQELSSITAMIEMMTEETPISIFLSSLQALIPFLEARNLYELARSLFSRFQAIAERQKDKEYLAYSKFYLDLLNTWQGNLVQPALYCIPVVKELSHQQLEM